MEVSGQQNDSNNLGEKQYDDSTILRSNFILVLLHFVLRYLFEREFPFILHRVQTQ